MKKRILVPILIALFSIIGIAYADNPISIYINGQKIQSDAQIIDGKTMVPIKTVFESLGAQVNWNGDSVFITTDPIIEPMITGPNDFTSLIHEALNLTKQKDVAVYDYICTGITTIDFGPGEKGYTAFNINKNVHYVDSDFSLVEQDLPNHSDQVAYYVASLMHEASHTHIYKQEGFFIGDSGYELAICNINALRALQICCDSPKIEQSYESTIENELNLQ